MIKNFRENDKKKEKMIRKYMAKCKELLLLKKRIVWQLDQPERTVSEQELSRFSIKLKGFHCRS